MIHLPASANKKLSLLQSYSPRGPCLSYVVTFYCPGCSHDLASSALLVLLHLSSLIVASSLRHRIANNQCICIFLATGFMTWQCNISFDRHLKLPFSLFPFDHSTFSSLALSLPTSLSISQLSSCLYLYAPRSVCLGLSISVCLSWSVYLTLSSLPQHKLHDTHI